MVAFASSAPLLFSTHTTQPKSVLFRRWKCSAAHEARATVLFPEAAMTAIPGGGVTTPQGFRAAGVCAGLKASGKKDLAVVICDTDHSVAGGVFTKSIVKAAPVLLSQRHINSNNTNTRAIVINSGQANAATGAIGEANSMATVQCVADSLGCAPQEVLIASTGVIGVVPDLHKLEAAIPQLISLANSNTDGGTEAAAEAIMTTDLRAKYCAYTMGGITVGGMAKGSGMIHPNMATMLAVVTCDAGGIPKATWNTMVREAADVSFNCITVDGDTSTNDCVLALASGKVPISNNTLQNVQALLNATMIELAKRVARDGEGASVLLEVHVSGAACVYDARSIARTVASSSLFKAAVFGCDPNWGRIAAAVGRAPACINNNSNTYRQDELHISLGGTFCLMKGGQPVDFDQKAASNYLKAKASATPDQYLTEHDTVRVDITVGSGPGSATAWGCDLSYKYVEINAEYTT